MFTKLPGVVTPVAFPAPLVAAPAPAFVTAQKSQVIARNYTAAVASPLAYTAPVAKVAAAPLAYSAAPLAYTAPSAYAAPFAVPYAAYPYGSYVL